MEVKIFTYNKEDEQVSQQIGITGDFFLDINEMRYRFGVERDGSLLLTLINGQDAKITSDEGYPAVKLIGYKHI